MNEKMKIQGRDWFNTVRSREATERFTFHLTPRIVTSQLFTSLGSLVHKLPKTLVEWSLLATWSA